MNHMRKDGWWKNLNLKTWIINMQESQAKNKVTSPAATPRHFSFFPASQFWFLQPFQGFVIFAWWHDLQIYCYLQDFGVVFMNLQWSKQFFLGPHCFKKPKFLVLSLASLCQLAKFFQPRILGHIGSPDKTVYYLESFDSSRERKNFWTPIPLEYISSN